MYPILGEREFGVIEPTAPIQMKRAYGVNETTDANVNNIVTCGIGS